MDRLERMELDGLPQGAMAMSVEMKPEVMKRLLAKAKTGKLQITIERVGEDTKLSTTLDGVLTSRVDGLAILAIGAISISASVAERDGKSAMILKIASSMLAALWDDVARDVATELN
jgi:hypothetical protein